MIATPVKEVNQVFPDNALWPRDVGMRGTEGKGDGVLIAGIMLGRGRDVDSLVIEAYAVKIKAGMKGTCPARRRVRRERTRC